MLSSNAVWALAQSPYLITDTLQIPEGITLQIEEGVVVKCANQVSYCFLVHGSVSAEGSKNNPIIFDANTKLLFSQLNAPDTMLITLNNTHINNSGGIIGGDDSGHGRGSLQLINSTVTKMTRASQILRPRGSKVIIQKNIFIDSKGFLFGDNSLNQGISIINNRFVSKYGGTGSWIETKWIESGMTIRDNSFLSEGIAISVGEAYQGNNIDLSNNYWGTTSTQVIDGKIEDYNDKITLAGPLNYQPFLTEPHPETP